ncbi:MAG TPA: transketolase [Rhizomicrobium sp.]|nr:transketolase [Rhizomicrobium sp.]
MHSAAEIRRLANAIRALSMDAVEKANSGHPGMPMGMADVATVLFSRFLKFDASAPKWTDRDRFVLSAGHGSMLLYSILYLTGYEDITIKDIENFRQLGSPCAGHPEYGHLAGIETTTGPLGQGIATAVGMAIAERSMHARFGDDLVDHKTYVIASDGDLMEGISHEAISLAGHLRLSKLIVLYDNNNISIDGDTELSDSTNTRERFEAAGWITHSVDGLNADEVASALEEAQHADRPTLISCRTVIGFGAPKKAGTAKAHGEALGAEEIAGARKNLDWNYPPFVVPDDLISAWREIGAKGKSAREVWEARAKNADASFAAALSGELPASFGAAIEELKKKTSAEKPSLATRKSSEAALEVINAQIPITIGGSADLTGSNNTKTKGLKEISPSDFSGRYMHYGIREHGMAAAMNGMALHGGVIPYGGTFLIFSDYCKPAIRIGALAGIRVIYVMTHDSIGLGEDGPTHQSIEQLAGLRAMPNLLVFRPADGVETAECWQLALENHKGPSLLALTRQNLPTVRTEHTKENLCARGAYELAGAKDAKVTFLATGSEIDLAMKARDLLAKDGIAARVVSMPCWELFEQQSETYRETTLGPGTVRIAIEAAAQLGWDRYIGPKGAFIGMHTFGTSAPYKDAYKHFGITPEAAADAARKALS